MSTIPSGESSVIQPFDNVNPDTGEVTSINNVTVGSDTQQSQELVNAEHQSEYQDGTMVAAFEKAGIKKENLGTLNTPQQVEIPRKETEALAHTTQNKPSQETRNTQNYYVDKELESTSRLEGIKSIAKRSNERIGKSSDNFNSQSLIKQSETKQNDQPQQIEKSSSTPKPALEMNPKNEPSLEEQMKKAQEDKAIAAEIVTDSNKSEEERKKAFKKMIASEEEENRIREQKAEIEEVILGFSPIPKPMKEVMNQIFDEKYRIRGENIAFEYATKEEQYYRDAKRRREDQLRANTNMTEAQINATILGESALIRERVQAHLKKRITSDVKELTTRKILSDPDRYKDFINADTGEVIDSISKGNLTGKILAERVYSRWHPMHISEAKQEPTPKPTLESKEAQAPIPTTAESPQLTQAVPTKEPTPEPIVEASKSKEKKKEPWVVRHLGLVGSVAGTTLGFLFGKEIVVIGAAASVVSLGVKEFSGWRIKRLTEKLNNAQTSEEKAILEKKIQNLTNTKERADKALRFFFGFGIGSFIGSYFTGGQGLVQALQAKKVADMVATGPANEPIIPKQPSGEIRAGNIQEPIIPKQPINEVGVGEINIPTGTDIGTIEAPSLGNTFNSGLSYQEASQLGWKGTELYLTNVGGNHGIMQGEFFNRIYQGLGGNLSRMQGLEAARAYNPFLQATVTGRMGVEEAANQALQALQALP